MQIQERRADKKINKAYKIAPQRVAERTRLLFPCTPVNTITRTEIDTIEVEVPCPIDEVDNNAAVNDGGNSVTPGDRTQPPPPLKVVTKTVKVPCETKYITTVVEDSAKIKEIISATDKQVVALKKQVQKQNNLKNIFVGSTVILFIITLILGFILGRSLKH